MALILRRTPRNDGMTVFLLDLDGIRRAQVVIPTVDASTLAPSDLDAMLELATAIQRGPTRTRRKAPPA